MNLDLFAAELSSAQSAPHVEGTTARVEGMSPRRVGFHNTTNLTGDELSAAISKAGDQNTAILAIYRNTSGPLTPWEVLHRCEAAGRRWPITSIRRSITTLCQSGALVRLPTQRVGDLGRPEHEWQAAA